MPDQLTPEILLRYLPLVVCFGVGVVFTAFIGFARQAMPTPLSLFDGDESRREEFEIFMRAPPRNWSEHDLRQRDGQYVLPSVQGAWLGWNLHCQYLNHATAPDALEGGDTTADDLHSASNQPCSCGRQNCT